MSRARLVLFGQGGTSAETQTPPVNIRRSTSRNTCWEDPVASSRCLPTMRQLLVAINGARPASQGRAAEADGGKTRRPPFGILGSPTAWMTSRIWPFLQAVGVSMLTLVMVGGDTSRKPAGQHCPRTGSCCIKLRCRHLQQQVSFSCLLPDWEASRVWHSFSRGYSLSKWCINLSMRLSASIPAESLSSMTSLLSCIQQTTASYWRGLNAR